MTFEEWFNSIQQKSLLQVPEQERENMRWAWNAATAAERERCESRRFAAVNRIVEDLSDRRGLSQEWDYIESDIRNEIICTWLDIVLTAIRGDWPLTR